ncbi:MAG: hypothetical protein EXS08_12195 [Planctomycetes bacterium]|nr:hypothetical protein [Planctomycetota bacterium]
MSRAFSWLLRLVLVLALGLGPLGAQGLAQLLHAPLCACCAPAQAERDCCASTPTNAERPVGPELSAPRKPCACALALPNAPSTPSIAPATSETRIELRAQLELAQRVQLYACLQRSPGHLYGARPPGTIEAGPPGHARAHGAERAAALGVLRL